MDFKVIELNFKIIAVNFDGTLCENKWPEQGAPNLKLIAWLKEQKALGAKLILWTCRKGKPLKEAVNWSAGQGLLFDAVNENLPEVEAVIGSTRKIYADEYIEKWDVDDKTSGLIREDMPQSERMELWGRLIDVVEDWLTEKDPAKETEEDGAIIVGDDYDFLANRFAKAIGISRNTSI